MALPSIAGLDRLGAGDCTALRERLAVAGYDGPFVGEIERVAPLMLDRLRRPLVRWWLRSHPGPAADLAALFGYGEAIGEVLAVGALGEALAARLLAEGVLAAGEGRTVRSEFLLLPYEGQWFLSDHLERGGEAVMGPGMTTAQLHRMLPEVLGPAVLDLGCGAGSLAIDAARRGARVTAVDVSERALAVTRFNARLNGVTVETACGDVVAPVRGRLFDLVLSQPPYVPQPEAVGASTYLHGGRWGDELALRFVEGCARVLAPGGIALMHFDSAVRPGAPLQDRLRAAIADAPAELLAFVSRGPSPDLQAILYAGVDHADLGEEFDRDATANRVHLERLGVSEIARVLAVLRRPAGGDVPGGRYRIVLASPPAAKARPGAVREALDALELASATDEALLAARVAPPADATFAGEWRSPADASPARLQVTFAAGSLAQDRELGDRGWLLLGLLDGSRPVGDVVAPFAERCGTGAGEAAAEVTGFVREALARGLLRAVPPSS